MQGRITLMVITPTLECGGAEKYTTLLCNNISPEKFRVVLVVVDNSNPFFKVNDNIEVVNLHRKRVSGIFLPLKKLLRKIKPDIIFSTANHVSLFGALTRSFYGHRCKWIARETSMVSVNTKRARNPFLYSNLLKLAYRKLDLVICQHQAMQDDLANHFNVPVSRSIVIPPGIEVNNVSDSPDIELLTVGRLSVEKGIDRILDSLERMQRPFRYVIAGEGEQRYLLEQKAKQFSDAERIIKFAGNIENPVGKFSGARVLLSGSYYEGSPNALLEANYLGIPVVAFDVPGTREVVREGWNGFLVEDGNVEEFARKIGIALEFPFKREEIAAYTREEFGLKKMIKRTEAAILQLLNRHDD